MGLATDRKHVLLHLRNFESENELYPFIMKSKISRGHFMSAESRKFCYMYFFQAKLATLNYGPPKREASCAPEVNV